MHDSVYVRGICSVLYLELLKIEGGELDAQGALD